MFGEDNGDSEGKIGDVSIRAAAAIVARRADSLKSGVTSPTLVLGA